MARKKSKKKKFRIRNFILSALVSLVVGAAIREQLSRPPQERTWHGEIAGIPYDFRIPSIEKLRATWWNPDDSRLIVPQPFGVGWTFNFYRLLQPVLQKRLQPESAQVPS